MPTVKGRGQKARLVRGLNLVLRAHSEYDVFNCHVTTRAWAPPLSPPQVLRCGLEAPAPADSLEHGRCGRLGRCPFPVTPSRRDARTRRGPTGSVISRQLLRVLSPRWALGDREADRNRGGGGGGRLREGRDPSGHPRRAWSCEDLREAAAACLWGDTDGYLLASASTAQRPAPLELENVSQRASPPHPRLTHFTLPDPRP